MVTLVTGAAGGIGDAVVRLLGESGTEVAAVDRAGDQLAAAAEKWAADGLPVSPFAVDVTSASAVEAGTGEVEDALGPIDALVNAAGVLRTGEARRCTDEDWAATFAVNVNGVFNVSRSVVNRMVPRGRGAIVTVASNAAAVPRTGMAAYAASKAAAAMFTKNLGLEVARHGIRCNVVAPGSTDTPMLRSMWRTEADRLATIEGKLEGFRVGIPLGRIAEPAQIAEAVVFLLSDRAAQTTMSTLTVDGGAALGC